MCQIMNQIFTIEIDPITKVPNKSLMSAYCSSWNPLIEKEEDDILTVRADKDKYQVGCKAYNLAPEDIKIKVINRSVIIEAKQDEKEDEYHWISREFTRKYIIPEEYDIDQVTSTHSSDGIFTICVPKKLNEEGEKLN